MLEKMIGVSPPQQVGPAHESKALGPANLRDTAGAKSYKLDFEQALKQKNAQQKQDLEKKHEEDRREDLRADRNKKSSGGTKKKMTEVDEKMVSNGMASKESTAETPVSKEETAKIQVNQNEIKPAKLETAEAAAELNSADAALAQEPQGEKPLTETAGDIEAQLTAAIEKNAQAAGEVKVQAQPQGADADSHLNSVEQELGAAVQYQAQASVKAHSAADAKALAQAKGDDAAAAALDSGKGFEQNVLSQLQRDGSFNSNTSGDSQEQGSSEKRDGGDLKADLAGNELHQAAGQSHTNFKSHIEAGAVKGTLDSNAQLEGHREANINELMNQAEYLVKKGGGEMTVKMSPEGMGEVQLKVQLLNGKLSVELQTQDHDVKKLIEDSLSDLKSGLAAHRISLEHVKINNTVTATNADNSAQMQSNLNHGGHDGRARDSFSDMQQQMNQHMQQRSQNNSGASTSTTGVSVAPRSISQVSQAQALRTYGGTKGATINRVA